MRTETQTIDSEMMFELDANQIDEVSGAVAPILWGALVVVAGAAPEIEAAVTAAISETGATSIKDMGKVMKTVQAALAGKNADGKLVADTVKAKLTT